jgi:hypothetical protein
MIANSYLKHKCFQKYSFANRICKISFRSKPFRNFPARKKKLFPSKTKHSDHWLHYCAGNEHGPCMANFRPQKNGQNWKFRDGSHFSLFSTPQDRPEKCPIGHFSYRNLTLQIADLSIILPFLDPESGHLLPIYRLSGVGRKVLPGARKDAKKCMRPTKQYIIWPESPQETADLKCAKKYTF